MNDFEKKARAILQEEKAARIRRWAPNFRISIELSFVVLQLTLFYMRLDKRTFDWIAFRWRFAKVNGEAALYWNI